MIRKLNTLLIAACVALVASLSACSRSYPCPGNGLSTAADMSQFEENEAGEMVLKGNGKKSRKGKNGLIKKKSPKKIRRR